MWRFLSFWLVLLCLGWLVPSRLAGAEAELCAICGRPLTEGYYTIEDRSTQEKKHVCVTCERSFPGCFVCGLPADTNAPGFVLLADQRALCARDARTAVLREEDGLRICNEVHDQLDRLFSRFTSFPETNVTIQVMDRVDLQRLLKMPGNDEPCPNVWGLTQTERNRYAHYRISIMTGLPLRWFQATSAHEYGHAWVGENVAESRRQRLDRDAEEGFCELLAYLLMDSLNDRRQQEMILRNPYTRGQVGLFVAAERSDGFNQVLDWMQFGLDPRLSDSDPESIRNVAARPNRSLAVTLTEPPKLQGEFPNRLVLKALFWDEKNPRAVINDRAFRPNEEGRVRLGKTNVLIRCLRIDPEGVQLRVLGTAQEQVLRLEAK